jgi:hypothetical protein
MFFSRLRFSEEKFALRYLVSTLPEGLKKIFSGKIHGFFQNTSNTFPFWP